MAAVVSQTYLKIAVADGPNQWREIVRHRVVVVWRVGDEHGKRCCGMPAPFDQYGTVHAGRTNEHTGLNIRHLGYGKLSSWDRIAERADAILIAASGSHVRASDGSVRIDAEHSRRLPVRHAHHRIDFNRRAQFSRQLVFALNGIPTAITDIAGIFDQHHHAGTDDREAPRIVQGYGMLLKMDFHDSTCDSNFRTNEQIDRSIRCNRYLDRTLQV